MARKRIKWIDVWAQNAIGRDGDLSTFWAQTEIFVYFIILNMFSWCPEGDLNPHGLAACGF
jgi:hypothetical protein